MSSRKPPVQVKDYPELTAVVTLAEAARRVYRCEQTLRFAIDRGHIAAVKCGRIWLVSVRSLENHYS